MSLLTGLSCIFCLITNTWKMTCYSACQWVTSLPLLNFRSKESLQLFSNESKQKKKGWRGVKMKIHQKKGGVRSILIILVKPIFEHLCSTHFCFRVNWCLWCVDLILSRMCLWYIWGNLGPAAPSGTVSLCLQSLLAFLLSLPFSSSSVPSGSSWCFLFFVSSELAGDGCGRRVMMTQVMLSHPVPSPDVSGAKQWSNSCQEDIWVF